MILIRKISFSLRDMWVGAYWLTYRRKASGLRIVTDVWVCPLPFVKFWLRIKHLDISLGERCWIDAAQYDTTVGVVSDDVDSPP